MGSQGNDPKATQVMSRNQLLGGGDNLANIVQQIEQGEEPRRIFSAIAECATNTPGVCACALFLPSERQNNRLERVSSFGEQSIQAPDDSDVERAARLEALLWTL